MPVVEVKVPSENDASAPKLVSKLRTIVNSKLHSDAPNTPAVDKQTLQSKIDNTVTAVDSSSTVKANKVKAKREAHWEAERGQQLLDVFDALDTDGDKRVAFTDVMSFFARQRVVALNTLYQMKDFYVFKKVAAAALLCG